MASGPAEVGGSEDAGLQVADGLRRGLLGWQVEGGKRAPQRLDGGMQPAGASAWALVRLSGEPWHLHAQGASRSPDEGWRGRRVPGLDLGEQAVEDVRSPG